MSNLAGQQLGQYAILEMLGQGGMATVYRARQLSMNRDVAVKVIDPMLTNSDEFVQRFDREARAVAMLSHAHVLKVFDFGRQDNLAYLVMELLTGGTLADQIAAGALPLPMVTRVMDQIASALDYAHGKGIIHRDIKPQNVLFDEAGHAFLADFGIVKLVGESSNLTETGSVVGTPAYIAPEHWLGKAVDFRTDLYALGVVLYEMLSGQLPFRGDTLYSMMQLHVNDLPAPVHTVRDGLAPEMAHILDRALAKSPDSRYQTARALVDDLERALSSGVRPAAGPGPAAAEDATSAVPVVRGPQAAPPASSTPTRRAAPPAQAPNASERAFYETSPMPIVRQPAPQQAAPVPAARTTPSQPTESLAPRSRLPLIVGGLALLVVAIVVVVSALGNQGGGTATADASQTGVALVVAGAESVTPTETATTGALAGAPTDTTSGATPSTTATVPPFVSVRVTDTATASRTPSITATFTASPSPTLTPTVRQTDTPPPTLRPTATSTSTSTATSTPTPDAAASATAASTATMSAISAEISSIVSSGERVFGPQADALAHLAADRLVQIPTGLRLGDFVAEITFHNPYGADAGTWDYGLEFRETAADRKYQLILRSNGRLALLQFEPGLARPAVIVDQPLTSLNTAAGAENTIRLAVLGARGFLSVNGVFETDLDLSGSLLAGDITAAAGMLGSLVVGETTRYEDFSIWVR